MIKKIMLYLLLTTASLMYTSLAQAFCSYSLGTFTTVPDIKIAESSKKGSVLATAVSNYTRIECNKAISVNIVMTYMGAVSVTVPGHTDVYETNIAGIGIKACFVMSKKCLTKNAGTTFFKSQYVDQLEITFIQTTDGSIASGSITGGVVGRMTLNNDIAMDVIIKGSGNSNIPVEPPQKPKPTCSVYSGGNITTSFIDMTPAEMTGNKDIKKLAVTLYCQDGDFDSGAGKLTLRLNTKTAKFNSNYIATNIDDIAIQLINTNLNKTMVPFTSYTINNVSKYYTINLTAAVVAKANSTVSGKYSATATLEITYD